MAAEPKLVSSILSYNRDLFVVLHDTVNTGWMMTQEDEDRQDSSCACMQIAREGQYGAGFICHGFQGGFANLCNAPAIVITLLSIS